MGLLPKVASGWIRLGMLCSLPSPLQEILDIPVAEIEAIAEPNGVEDDNWWKSVTFTGIHHQILVEISGLTCQYRPTGYTRFRSVLPHFCRASP